MEREASPDRLSPDQIDRAFKALADPIRRRLLCTLDQPQYFCRQGERAVDGICVRDLAELLKLPQSTVSRHLAVLTQSGLVTLHRDGLWHYYQLNRDRVSAVSAWLKEFSCD